MKRLLFVISLLSIALFSSLSLYAQTPAFAWGKAVGGSGDDEARAVAPTPDGGYIVAGYTNSTDGDISGLTQHGGYDYLVVKFGADGSMAWKKTYGGSKDDKAYAITPTSDNGYIVAGTSNSNDGDVNGDNHINSNNNQPSNDFWIVKLDGQGTIQWAKSYGGGNDDEATGILQTPDDGYVISGYSNSVDGDNNNGSGTYDYWVVRIDKNGAVQWNQTYGGKGVDKAFAMARAQDGGYFLTGISLSSGGQVTGTNHGDGDCWTIKIDSGGTLLWNYLTGGSGADQGNGIYGTSDNGCIVAASTGSTNNDLAGDSLHGDIDGWVIKLNATGGLSWQKTYGGNLADFAESIYPTNDGGYIIAGQTASNNLQGAKRLGQANYWLLKINGSGSFQWQGIYGGAGTDMAYSVYPTSDTGYVVAGVTSSDDSEVTGDHLSGGAPTNDMWIMKAGGSSTHTGVKEGENIIPGARSLVIFPNPSASLATISFELPDAENTDVSIYNMLGEKMQTLARGMQSIGSHFIALNLNGYCDGVYLCKMESAAGSAVKLLEVVKQ
ncbi:MAG TPA: T9SS type A sorting domain-containing protein [Candidatus Kapabacteria bacterium]|nr:T9SS type A sorting domain-containing protein [Candidatus Kapabacteria bacterium]